MPAAAAAIVAVAEAACSSPAQSSQFWFKSLSFFFFFLPPPSAPLPIPLSLAPLALISIQYAYERFWTSVRVAVVFFRSTIIQTSPSRSNARQPCLTPSLYDLDTPRDSGEFFSGCIMFFLKQVNNLIF
jgi:hypothetical protein